MAGVVVRKATCSTCGGPRDQKGALCSTCRRDYNARPEQVAKRREVNMRSYRVEARRNHNGHRVRRAKAIIDALKSVPCADCGRQFPPHVMDFDHRDGSEKSFGIGGRGHTVPLEKLLLETGKCDVVCANCHRDRTHTKRPPSRIRVSALAVFIRTLRKG